MKKYILFLVLFLGIFAFGQVPRFAKYDVAETGAQLYLPSEPKWEKSVSEDKSEIYLTSVVFGDVEYGVIAVSYTHLDVYKRQVFASGSQFTIL